MEDQGKRMIGALNMISKADSVGKLEAVYYRPILDSSLLPFEP